MPNSIILTGSHAPFVGAEKRLSWGCLHLLDTDAEGANWTAVAWIVSRRDPTSDVAPTRCCRESHLVGTK